MGSNLVHELNARGDDDVVVVDDLADVRKVANLSDTSVVDYFDRSELLRMVSTGSRDLDAVRAVLHQGARTSTVDDDGRGVMADNFTYSRALLRWCRTNAVPLVYASSAAVYGDATDWSEEPENERALNVYAWSKQVFDAHVRAELRTHGSQVVGLRYFNLYGPREDHKDQMASVVAQFDHQARSGQSIRVFGAGCGRGAGEHRRDFVHVDDVVRVVLWFLDHPDRSGIFNCGTGTSRSFGEVAGLVARHHDGALIEHVPFPTALVGRYQPDTRADLTRLRAAGCDEPFRAIDEGIPSYLAWRDRCDPVGAS